MSKVHDFQECLERSHSYADAGWWFEVYRNAFPDLLTAANIRQDGWAQRAGIDRILTLESGRTITVDEKVREEDWPDILLEYYSDMERKTRGWVAKDLACDFIAYAFMPSRTCYLLPTLTLRIAWRQNHKEWVNRYKDVRAQNKGYVTQSVAVPTKTLIEAMGNSMKVTWND